MTKTQPDGFLAGPDKGRGVLVLHAWWGLNDTFKGVCTRLANEGFVAFAPDLYHGKIARTIREAEAAVNELDAKHVQAEAEVAAAAAFLSERASGALAVIGFSMGAYYALDLSVMDAEHVGTVVLFYGSGLMDFSKSKSRYLAHFAEKDPYEPKENVEALKKALEGAGRPLTIHQYPGTGHWFFEPDRPDAYNAAAAKLAWDRTLAFLKGG